MREEDTGKSLAVYFSYANCCLPYMLLLPFPACYFNGSSFVVIHCRLLPRIAVSCCYKNRSLQFILVVLVCPGVLIRLKA